MKQQPLLSDPSSEINSCNQSTKLTQTINQKEPPLAGSEIDSNESGSEHPSNSRAAGLRCDIQTFRHPRSQLAGLYLVFLFILNSTFYYFFFEIKNILACCDRLLFACRNMSTGWCRRSDRTRGKIGLNSLKRTTVGVSRDSRPWILRDTQGDCQHKALHSPITRAHRNRACPPMSVFSQPN